MTLSKVEGQPRAVETLKGALRSGAVHHAYLFTGPEGVGRELAAIGFVQALLCAVRPNEGCGTCDACLRVEKMSHPDVTWVMPQEEMVARKLAGRSDFSGTVSKEIRVEQVRSLQERLSLRSLEGGYKAALLPSAERMNPQAQNALLKTLEEPPARPPPLRAPLLRPAPAAAPPRTAHPASRPRPPPRRARRRPLLRQPLQG